MKIPTLNGHGGLGSPAQEFLPFSAAKSPKP
jgi:hypothetical protein